MPHRRGTVSTDLGTTADRSASGLLYDKVGVSW